MLDNKIFICNHISDDMEKDDIEYFKIEKQTGYGLVRYLQEKSLHDEIENNARTYLVRDKEDHSLVGYFTLKTGLVTTYDRTTRLSNLFNREFDTIPGIELANFAVNAAYKEEHEEAKNLGLIIFQDFIFPLCQEVAKSVGVKVIYIFALPYRELLSYYENKLKFSRLDFWSEKRLHRNIKPRYDQGCIFMYQIL